MNNIGDQGGLSFFRNMGENGTFEEIDLSACGIGFQTIYALHDILKTQGFKIRLQNSLDTKPLSPKDEENQGHDLQSDSDISDSDSVSKKSARKRSNIKLYSKLRAVAVVKKMQTKAKTKRTSISKGVPSKAQPVEASKGIKSNVDKTKAPSQLKTKKSSNLESSLSLPSQCKDDDSDSDNGDSIVSEQFFEKPPSEPLGVIVSNLPSLVGLSSIKLSANPLDENCGKLLFEAVKSNDWIKKMDLRATGIGPQYIEAIQEILRTKNK